MSVNAVDPTTGNTTSLAGNTNNLVGNLSALTTNTKSDAVGAINEVNQTKQNATDNNLQTTDKTVAGAINELKSGLTNLEPQVVTGYTAGGYCNNIGASTTVIKMGKLIVANINLEMVSGEVPSGGTLIDGLPIPKNRAYASAVSGNNMARVTCFNGTLTVDGGTTGGGWWNILLVYVVN